MTLRIGSLATGYGGLDEAVRQVLDAELAWVADIDPGACKILAHRYPDVPNLGDIARINWATVEPVDILTGGTPCPACPAPSSFTRSATASSRRRVPPRSAGS